MTIPTYTFGEANTPVAAASGAAFALYFADPAPMVVFAVLGGLAALWIVAEGAAPRSIAAREILRAVFAALCVGLLLGAAVRVGLSVGEERAHIPVAPERVTAVRGRTTAPTRRTDSGFAAELRVSEVRTESGSYSARLELPVYGLERAIGRGRSVTVSGELGRGERGLYIVARSLVAADWPRGVGRVVADARSRLAAGFTHLGGAGGLARALLLGQRDGLTAYAGELFRRSGTAHILALSGMHLGILVGLAVLLISPVLGRRTALVTSVVLSAAYLLVVGFRASLLRAAVMFTLVVVAVIRDRKPEPLRVLAGAFLILAVGAPGSVDGLSFKLSFAALAGILVLGRWLDRVLLPWVPSLVRGPLAASAGAQMATMPILLGTFGVARPIGIAATLVLAPLAVLFVWISVASLVLALAGAARPVELWAAPVLEALETAMMRTAELFAAVPGVRVPQTGLPGVAALTLAAFALVWALQIPFASPKEAP
jgi:competence protein ComEC